MKSRKGGEAETGAGQIGDGDVERVRAIHSRNRNSKEIVVARVEQDDGRPGFRAGALVEGSLNQEDLTSVQYHSANRRKVRLRRKRRHRIPRHSACARIRSRTPTQASPKHAPRLLREIDWRSRLEPESIGRPSVGFQSYRFSAGVSLLHTKDRIPDLASKAMLQRQSSTTITGRVWEPLA